MALEKKLIPIDIEPRIDDIVSAIPVVETGTDLFSLTLASGSFTHIESSEAASQTLTIGSQSLVFQGGLLVTSSVLA
jgi:hypothetical protein